MNETRKQIIELISDYMDKTLNEGCLIKFEDNGITTFDTFIGDFGEYFDCIYEKEIYFEKEHWEKIGHYDITAVLKYIENTDTYDNKSKLVICKSVINFYELNIEIPHKPLHLYTEQEEKELLEILLKLK